MHDPTLLEAIRIPGRPLRLVRQDLGYRLLDEEEQGPSSLIFVPPCLPENLGDPSFRTDHRFVSPISPERWPTASAPPTSSRTWPGRPARFLRRGRPVPWRVERHRPPSASRRRGSLTASISSTVRTSPISSRPSSICICVGACACRGVGVSRSDAPRVAVSLRGIHAGTEAGSHAESRSSPKCRASRWRRKFFWRRRRSIAARTGAAKGPHRSGTLAARIPGPGCDRRANRRPYRQSPRHHANPDLAGPARSLAGPFGYDSPLRVGAAGGIATPASAAAAFAMGAAYVLTGSINQAASNLAPPTPSATCSPSGQADVVMAPAADMFEMGVKVQVLKRGTMFAMRAAKLYELYRAYAPLEDIPPEVRESGEEPVPLPPGGHLETDPGVLPATRHPSQLQKAQADPRHRMALVFRWYLGLASPFPSRLSTAPMACSWI